QQQNPDPSQTQAKKPTKDFKEVLDQPGAKTQLAGGKKKSTFSPLSQEKSGKPDKLQTQSSKGHARVEEKEERESIGESELGAGKKKKTVSPEDVQIQPTPMTSGPGAVQTAVKAEKTHAAAGLKMEELQSIVQKVHVGINEQGKPEMNFQIQTHNLGPMDLKVSADGDKIKLDFVTEDINAQNVLKENLDELSNQLREKGLTLAQTNFSTRDQDQNEQQQQQQEQAWEGPMYAPTAKPKKGFNL
ncbi:MAG TPA: flagellar hook-length control protein FliK, partial [Acidobacteriota bacterium]|nr:flagellar hook-length control protein FliK [Acidobacteriota bacterium]